MMKENNDDLQVILQELEGQFQSRLDALQTDLEQGKQRQAQAYSAGMLKLNKSIKHMKVSEFQALYKVDLLEQAQRIKSCVKKRPLMETPLASKSSRGLATPSRTARKDETLFSENGSPIEVEDGTLVATVAKKKRKGTLQLHVAPGRTVTLMSQQDVANLNEQEQESALSQLLLMQNDIVATLELLQK